MVSPIEDQIAEVFWIQKSSLSRLKNTTYKERIDKLKSIEKYMISHKQGYWCTVFKTNHCSLCLVINVTNISIFLKSVHH